MFTEYSYQRVGGEDWLMVQYSESGCPAGWGQTLSVASAECCVALSKVRRWLAAKIWIPIPGNCGDSHGRMHTELWLLEATVNFSLLLFGFEIFFFLLNLFLAEFGDNTIKPYKLYTL